MTAQAGSATSPSPAEARTALRRTMRARRAALSAAERTTAALGIARLLAGSRLFRPGMRVGVYLAVHGEADLKPFIAHARKLRLQLYLPHIRHAVPRRMEFVAFTAGATLTRNRYGIPEPVIARRIPPRHLDRVLVPLVAFDPHGNRLGMGAGYYDRCFKFLRAGRGWRRPKLIGTGYEWQRVPSLAAAAWDVPLDAVVTERRLYRSP